MANKKRQKWYLQPFIQELIASFKAIGILIGKAPVPDQEH